MCLLTFLPAGVQPDAEALRCGARCNNDGHGYGIVVPGQDEILIGKGMDASEVIAEFVRLRAQYPDGPALFHSRLTTHGNTTVDNCHPFVVNGDPRTVVAHNGILPRDAHPQKIGTRVKIEKSKSGTEYEITCAVYDDRSDTRILADDLLMTRWGRLDSRHARKRLTRWLGTNNKILVLTTNPDYRRTSYLFNADLGTWTGGIWYSNASFRGYGRGATGSYPWDGAGYYSGAAYSSRAAALDADAWDDYDGYGDYDDSPTMRHYGYVKNDRGYWVPSTRDRWSNSGDADQASTWPVTLGGTRDTGSTKSPWIDFVSCDVCTSRSVDPDTGLCLDCYVCNDCVEYISMCECYGQPVTKAFAYTNLINALDQHRPASTIRRFTRDYHRVCATYQALADKREREGDAVRESVVMTALRELAAEPAPAPADAPDQSDEMHTFVTGSGVVRVHIPN
jgi:glutamine amidotransferase